MVKRPALELDFLVQIIARSITSLRTLGKSIHFCASIFRIYEMGNLAVLYKVLVKSAKAPEVMKHL